MMDDPFMKLFDPGEFPEEIQDLATRFRELAEHVCSRVPKGAGRNEALLKLSEAQNSALLGLADGLREELEAGRGKQ